jgi:tetraprenyl-beta-curcumene synthase
LGTAEPSRAAAHSVAARSTFVGTVAFHAAVALPLARREVARWRARAEAIADAALRERALTTLRDEHRNAEGAAAYAVLHPPAARLLVPLLVAYQLTWDLVDTLLERPIPATPSAEAVRRQLEDAVAERHRAPLPRTETPGFLSDLVDACQRRCAALPNYDAARPSLARLASRSDALLATNGEPMQRTGALCAWVARQPAVPEGLEPAELCAAGQCSLGVHAVLAAAARPGARESDFSAIEDAYYPWVDALCTLLDSLIDQEADARSGDFSFVSAYPSRDHATERLRSIAEQAATRLRTLPAPHRHHTLLCALLGTYLSRPAADNPANRPVAQAVLDATAPLSGWAREVSRHLLP